MRVLVLVKKKNVAASWVEIRAVSASPATDPSQALSRRDIKVRRAKPAHYTLLIPELFNLTRRRTVEHKQCINQRLPPGA